MFGRCAVKRRKRYLLLSLVSLLLLCAAWLVGVQGLWYIEYYPKTGSRRQVFEYRVAGLLVHEIVREDKTLVERIARDLGIENLDAECERGLWQRYWDLYICAAPCNCGTTSMGGPNGDDYQLSVQPGLLTLAQQEPQIVAEFQKRVIENRDMEYFHEFVTRCEELSSNPGGR